MTVLNLLQQVVHVLFATSHNREALVLALGAGLLIAMANGCFREKEGGPARAFFGLFGAVVSIAVFVCAVMAVSDAGYDGTSVGVPIFLLVLLVNVVVLASSTVAFLKLLGVPLRPKSGKHA